MNNQRSAEEIKMVAKVYESHRDALLGYIAKRITDTSDAEDMVQDVFVRLLELRNMICEATVKSFAYTIAHNLVIDYVRRRGKAAELQSYMYDRVAQNRQVSMESYIYMRNLEEYERRKVEQLPAQRRKVYYMSRYEGKEVDVIADELKLSCRTVETHLLLGRRVVRTYLKSVGFAD